MEIFIIQDDNSHCGDARSATKIIFLEQEELIGFLAGLWVTNSFNKIRTSYQLENLLSSRIISSPYKVLTKTSSLPDLPYSERWTSFSYRIRLSASKVIFLAFNDRTFLVGLERARKMFQLNFQEQVWTSDGQARRIIWPDSSYYSLIRSI